MKDSVQNIDYDYQYKCSDHETIYGPANPNPTDCIRIR